MTSNETMHTERITAMAGLFRGTGFLCLWVVLIGSQPTDLAPGLLAAIFATWASLRLLPPGPDRLQPQALAALVVRFLWQSVVAGWDVAWRAFDPRLPINPGFVRYPVRLPPGTGRNAFASLTSLLPGTVTVDEDGHSLLYHCLDVDQPVVAQLADEEAAFTRVLGRQSTDAR
jgi:multicomponent Na+:H+ antiporter subunit E